MSKTIIINPATASTIDLIDQLEMLKKTMQYEIKRLYIAAQQRQLTVKDSEALIQYTKLVNQLVKDEERKASEKE